MKRLTIAVIFTLSVLATSCTKADGLPEPTYCFIFVDHAGNDMGKLCGFTEKQAEEYRKKKNYMGYIKL